jgi:hypothetical protein
MKINRLKMQFDERKRKLIVSGAICSAKKRFFLVNLLSPDSIQEGEEENISVVAQGIPSGPSCPCVQCVQRTQAPDTKGRREAPLT